MAAAFSSGENVRTSRRAPSPRPHQRLGHGQPATGSDGALGTRSLQSRLSASLSREQSSFFRLPSATLSPRSVRGGLPPRGDAGIGGRGGEGGIGGVWASIVSLGAASLPASMTIPSSSAASTSEESRHEAETADATGSRARQRNMSVSSFRSGMLRAGMEGAEEVGGEGDRVGATMGPAPVRPAAGRAADADAPREASGARGSAAQNAPPVGAGATLALTSAPASVSMGRPLVPVMQKHVYLEGGSAVYTCAVCRAHLATRDHVVSECFHGHGGRAFLFERCVNVTAGRTEDRLLMTGMHMVADISCSGCGTELGWKYEEAAEKSQKYKEGKFILERCAVILEGCEGDARYGLGRDISNSLIGWGADQAPFADCGQW